MRWCVFGFLIFLIIGIESKPFFKSNFRSTTESNIADLRERLENSSLLPPPLNDDENQAVPGFIQKKIAKLFRKIQFFTSLANGFTTKKPEPDVDFEDIDNEDDFPKSNTTVMVTTESGEFSNSTFVENEVGISNATVYNKGNKEKEELDSTARLQNVKYEFSPVGIGIYFMELVGSLIGLVYGAALQVSNGTQQPSV
nr:uncharacterized protein LOC111416961 [Onthophagus taurus]